MTKAIANINLYPVKALANHRVLWIGIQIYSAQALGIFRQAFSAIFPSNLRFYPVSSHNIHFFQHVVEFYTKAMFKVIVPNI